MSHHSNLRILLSSCLLIPVFASAQTPRPVTNSDIIKMIQGHLPEVVIVNKIKASLATLDTSADALIALSKAGATEAELAAMTAVPAPAPIVVAAPVQQQAFEIAGGVLRRTTAGDPYIQFPERVASVFPNGEHSNQAFLVSYQGKPAIRIPTERFAPIDTSGNLIVADDVVLYNPYLVDPTAGDYPKHGKYVLPHGADKWVAKAAFSMPRTAVALQYEKYGNIATRTTSFSKHLTTFNVGFHYDNYFEGWKSAPCRTSENCMSPQLEAYVRDLIHNFAGTIAPLLDASGIHDVDRQLSANAHYTLIGPSDLPQYAALYQEQVNKMPPPTKSSGGGFMNGLVGTLAVVSAGANVLQAQQSGNIGAQLSAQQAYGQTVAQAVNGDSAGAAQTAANAAATIPPPSPTPPTPAPAPAAPAPKPAAKSVFKFNQHPAKPAATPAATTVAAAKPAPAPTPAPASTGTVAPPSCVYLGTSPGLGCVSLANWQQIQSAPETIMPPTTGATGPAQIYYIVNSDIPVGPGVHWCPKSGHIHTGHYDLSGKFIGQDSPCTVGYHVRITWPAGTGITPVSIQ